MNLDGSGALSLIGSVENLERDDIFLVLLALVGVDPPECADELWALVGSCMGEHRGVEFFTEYDDIFLVLLALVGVDPPECADELWALVGSCMGEL